MSKREDFKEGWQVGKEIRATHKEDVSSANDLYKHTHQRGARAGMNTRLQAPKVAKTAGVAGIAAGSYGAGKHKAKMNKYSKQKGR